MNTKRIGAAGAALLAASTMAGLRQQRRRRADVRRDRPTRARPTVTIMVGGMSKQIYLPFMLAKQLGYYDKIGVNVNLVDEPAGGDATQNMLAGQVQGVGGFYDHNIALQAQGKSSEAVVSMLQIPGEVELCRSDLKGKVNEPGRLQGPSARHHRHRLVDRLPDAVPQQEERRRPRRRRPAAASVPARPSSPR